MHKTFFAFATFSFAMLLGIASCGKDNTSADYTANADCSAIVSADNTYNNGIKAIIDAKCATAGCHNAFTASEGIDMSDYAKTKNVFEKKDALCTIHHGTGCKAMPDGQPKLSDATINQIDCWVKNGYLE